MRNETLPNDLMKKLINGRTGIINNVHVNYPYPGGPLIYRATATPAQFLISGGGVGTSEAQALTTAICEAIERTSAADPVSKIYIEGSYNELNKCFSVVHPDECPLFHSSQYPGVGFEPFNVDTNIYWSWAFSLTQQKPILVPSSFLYLYSPTKEGVSKICPMISTGLACGASLSDALLRGIYEIVERDALMIMWLNRYSCPRVSIPKENEIHKQLNPRLISDHIEHTLIWMQTDLPIYAFLAILVENDKGIRRVYVGGGCSLDPQVAAYKALLEAHHTRLCISRECMRAAKLEDPLKLDDFEKHCFYYAQQDRTALLDFLIDSPHIVDLKELENNSFGSSVKNLRKCLKILTNLGYEVIGADLTQEDVRSFHINAVRVVIPGMAIITPNNAWPFLGIPRIYQVPVKLGWRVNPITWNELNRDPHPFP